MRLLRSSFSLFLGVAHCDMNDSSVKELRSGGSRVISVEREFLTPIRALPEFRLLFLIKYAGLKRQGVHLRPHKTAITVLWRANYRLPSHIETGINDHRATGLLTERLHDLPIERVQFPAHGLNSRRIIHVCDGGDLGPDYIELLYPPQFLFFRGHLSKSFLRYVGHQKHVGAVNIHLKPVPDMFPEHTGREGPKAFPVLDFQIHH